jgi:DNA-binding ferritin-like protein (Dps family)
MTELTTAEILALAAEEDTVTEATPVEAPSDKELSTADILAMSEEELTSTSPSTEVADTEPKELSTSEILAMSEEDEGITTPTEQPQAKGFLDSIRFAPRNISDTQVTQWAKEFNLNEDKVRKYVELKGGVINALKESNGDTRKGAESMRGVLDDFVEKHGADVYKDSDLALMTSFVTSDEALAMFKDAPKESWRAIKNALILPLFMDRGSGSEEEKKFKEFLDSEGQLGSDIVLSRLVTDIALGGAAGSGAVKVLGKMAPGVVKAVKEFSPIKNLAMRLGATGDAALKVAKGADVGAKAVASSTGLGAVTGAATSREDKMLEDTVVGGMFGAAAPILAGTVVGVAKAGIGSISALKGLVTKKIASIVKPASKKVEARRGTERLLFDIAQSGDSAALPDNVDELTRIADELDISEKQVMNEMKNDEFRNKMGVSKKMEGLSEKQLDMREVAAKKSLLMKRMQNLNETDIRNKEFLYDIVEGKRKLPSDINKLNEVTKRLKISEKEIDTLTSNSEFRSKLGVEDVVNKLEKQELRKAAINDIILNRFEKIDPKKIAAERELYRIAKGDVKIDWTPANVNKFADELIDTKAIRSKMKSSEISKETGTKLAVDQMPEGDQAVLRQAALKSVILRKAQTELHGFASDFSPALMRQRATPYNVNSIISSMDSGEGFQEVVTNFAELFGEETIDKAKKAAMENGWRSGSKVLAEKAQDILKASKLEDSFKSSKDYIAKVIHDEGQDPEKVFNAFIEYRKYREANKMAQQIDIASDVKKTSVWGNVWNSIAPDHQKIDDIERRWDIEDLSVANLRINNKTQMLDNHAALFKNHINTEIGQDVNALVRSGDWDGEAFFKYVESPTTEMLESLKTNAKMKEVLPTLAAKFRKLDDAVLEEVGALGVKVDKRDNHISHVAMHPIKATEKIKDLVSKNETLQQLLGEGASRRKFISKLENDTEAKEILASLEYLTQSFDETGVRKVVKVESATDLIRALKRIDNPRDVAAAVSPMMQFTRARSESLSIPRLLLETDPRIILNKNIRSFLSSAYLKDEINTVYRNMRILENVGANAARLNKFTKMNVALSDAKQLERYLAKLTGTDVGVFQDQLTSRFQKMWTNRQFKKGMSENEINQALDVPRRAATIAQNIIYSAFFSAPKTAIRNTFQTGLNVANIAKGKLARELATEATLKSYAGLISPKGTAMGDRYVQIRDRLFKEGKLGREATGVLAELEGKTITGKVKEAGKIIQREYREGGKLGGTEALSTLYSKGMLSMFEAAENVNRVATAIFSEDYINLVRKGSVKLEDAFKDISSPGVKSKLTSFAKEGKWDDAQKLFEENALQKIQFVYNESNKANLIKDVGPIFGALLRYPSESIASMAGQIKAGNLEALTEKMIYPLVWTNIAGLYIKELESRNERFKATKEALYGKGTLPSITPVAALSALNIREQTPPAMKVMTDLLGALSGNEKSAEGLAKQVLTFVPGKPLANIFMDDIYTRLLLGETEVPVAGAEKEMMKGVKNTYRKVQRKVKKGAKELKDVVFD